MNSDAHISYFSIMCDFLKTAVIILLAAFLFFNSVIGVIILFPYGLYSVYKVARNVGERQRKLMTIQFKDAVSSMLTAMEAGYTMEASIPVALRDLSVMYGGKGRLIKQLAIVEHKLTLSENIEDAFLSLAESLGVREIQNFVDIFVVAKRSGGNIIGLLRAASQDMYAKQETRREIEGIIASAAMEASVMKIMPLAILLYLRIFSPNFIEALYSTPIGKVMMFIACIIYFVLSEYCERLISKAGRA